MKLILSLIQTLVILINTNIASSTIYNKNPRIIDAFKLAYDAIYTAHEPFDKSYIILDMESIHFVDTTYIEREDTIKYFSKYNKKVLNSSLFKLQEIGLANKSGQLQIDGVLLMITNITYESDGITIYGTKWIGPISAEYYKVNLKIINNMWTVIDIQSLGVP